MFRLEKERRHFMDPGMTVQTTLLILLHAVTLSSAESQSNSLLTFLRHFNVTRNNGIDPAATLRARETIKKTFREYEMITWVQEFSHDQQYNGYNTIGQLSGRYTGSRDDQILVIGAHYDTVRSTPGVDDNGSGVAALLQIAKQLRSTDILGCSRDYTLQLVAFDLSENQTCERALGNGSCGSYEFIRNLTHSMNMTGASFQGAFIIDTIMNHNMTNHSQGVHPEMKVWFPLQYGELQERNFRGDFVEAIGQKRESADLLRNFSKHFSESENFRVQVKELALGGRPSKFSAQQLTNYAHFFRSDHYRFWDNDPPLPAVFLSDTADYRGHMTGCYHSNCDDMAHVTEDMLVFLGKTTDALVASVQEMTRAKCRVKSTECDREWTGADGEFQSPYYPDLYPNSVSCQWLITVTPGHFLSLTFVDIELENSANCTNDFVEVRDGDDGKSSPLIVKLCGSKSELTLNSTGASVVVLFKSDAFVARRGFKANWSSNPIPREVRATSQAGVQVVWNFLLIVMNLTGFTAIAHW